MLVLVLIFDKKYNTQEAVNAIKTKFPGPKELIIVSNKPVNDSSVNIHIKYDLCNRSSVRFTKEFERIFDLVVYVTDSIEIVMARNIFGAYMMLKNKGCLAFLHKGKFSKEGIFLTDMARQQINNSFIIQKIGSEPYLQKIQTIRSYIPLVRAFCDKDYSCFSSLYEFLPSELKKFSTDASSLDNVKNKTFAENIARYNAEKQKEISFKVVKERELTPNEKLRIIHILEECFGIYYNFPGKGNKWFFLLEKDEIKSMLMIQNTLLGDNSGFQNFETDGNHILWNVCTSTKSRKKGFAEMLLKYTIEKQKTDLIALVKIKDGYEKLIRYYNSFGFIVYKKEPYNWFLIKKYISTGLQLCHGTNEKLMLDLNKIKVQNLVSVPKNFRYESSSSLPLLEYMGSFLLPDKILGSGSYGTVYQYSNKSALTCKLQGKKYNLKQDPSEPEMLLCVKFFKGRVRDREYNDEKNMIEKIDKFAKGKCALVNARAMEYSDTSVPEEVNKIIIMDCLDGTIDKNLYSVKDANKILKELAGILDCLYKNGFLYTDLGKQNIAYKCIGNTYKLLLIDLGGLCKIGEDKVFKKRGGTIRPKDVSIKDYYCSQNFIVWKLAVFYMSILQESTKEIPWWFKSITETEIEQPRKSILYSEIKPNLEYIIKDPKTVNLLYRMFGGYKVKDENVITLDQIKDYDL